MTDHTPNYDFSSLLKPDSQSPLADSRNWRWGCTFGFPDLPTVHHPAHANWLLVRGNTHTPPHREIMLTIHGCSIYSIEQHLYMRSPGTVILLNAHQQRDLKGSPDKRDFSCLWLQLHGRDRISYYVNSCDLQGRYHHEAPVGIRSGDSVLLINDAWDHCLQFPQDRIAWNLLQNAITAQLLDILGRITGPTSRSQQQVINTVVEYIHNHLSEKLSLHSLARLAGYSPFFFHRLFVRHTGQTPVAYINEIRLIRARELLADNHTVESVAAAVGFQSTSYFNQFFKKQSGLTPHAWRQAQSDPSKHPTKNPLHAQIKD